MAEGILTLNPMTPERDPDQLGSSAIIEGPLGAGIGLALANMLKDKNKENLPEEVDEEKTPQEEPPEGEPDLLPELTKQTAEEVIRKETKDKEPFNKIQTWDKFLTKEQVEKASKENNIPIKDFEIPALKKQITFRKHNFGYDILFDKKRVGELADITQSLIDFGNQQGNKKTFNLVFIDRDGTNQRDAVSTIDGIDFAKEKAKELVAQDLLRDTTEPLYPSLRDIFQNLEYDKKGNPAELEREIKKMREMREMREKQEKNKKAMGGMIDEPLMGRSRYI